MVQSKKLGVFTAPAPLPNRINPLKSWLPPPKVLPATSSPALRESSTPEIQLLQFLHTLNKSFFSQSNFQELISVVKGCLFRKEYEIAFGSEVNRDAYFVRWIPSRALIFRRIFKEIGLVRKVFEEGGEIVCIGGGAGSELVAIGSLVKSLGGEDKKVKVVGIDFCDWSNTVKKVETALEEEWNLTKSNVELEFQQLDVLKSPQSINYSKTNLITILFTISELFLQSKAQTIKFLQHLTLSTNSGALLLIVESAALSTIPIGTREYPIATLLDFTLCDDKATKEGGEGKWERLEESESWYRMGVDCGDYYPIKLEGSRVSIRVYRRL